jgi:hypothetical protein
LTLAEANRLVAHLGGFLGRTNDGEPGPESFALGLRRFMDMYLGWQLNEQRHLLLEEFKKSV